MKKVVKLARGVKRKKKLQDSRAEKLKMLSETREMKNF